MVAHSKPCAANMFNDAQSDFNPDLFENRLEYADCADANRSCCGAGEEYDNGLDSTLSFSVRGSELISNRDKPFQNANTPQKLGRPCVVSPAKPHTTQSQIHTPGD